MFWLDERVDCANLLLVMRVSRQRNYDYPAKTRGTEIARRIRAKANQLTVAERAGLQRRAMQLIYAGAANKETARSGQ